MTFWPKKIVSVLLCATMLTSLTACSGGTAQETETTPAETAETTPAETVPAEPSADELYPYQEAVYDGETFDFLIVRTGYYGQDYNDIWVEEDSAEALSAAVYHRNTQVEERHNIVIHAEEAVDPATPTVKLPSLVKAGDNTFEAIQEHLVRMMGTLVVQGYLQNIREIETMYLEAPWYDTGVLNSASIAGQVYFFGGDIEVSDKMGISVVAFNKELAKDHQIPDLYETVEEGKWTLDLLHEYASIGAVDLNGDGTLDLTDQWGLIAEDFYGWYFQVGSGCKIAEKDGDDIPYLTVYSENAVSGMENILELLLDKKARNGTGMLAEDYDTVFSEDRALFHANVLSSITILREMETPFGIIPMPKGSEDQAEYITTFSPYVARYIAIPTTNTELTKTGVILDAMSRTGDVSATYYDVVLNGRTTRDEESAGMLDLIFDSITTDIGSCYNWGDVWFLYFNVVNNPQAYNFTSTWQKIEKRVQTAMDKTIAVFRKAAETKGE